MPKQVPSCEKCGSDAGVVPILYGEPSPNAEAARARGELVLGGCMIFDSQPAWYCRACKHDLKADWWRPFAEVEATAGP